jgi:glycosyltransferase involved in cell wall biosynthesis
MFFAGHTSLLPAPPSTSTLIVFPALRILVLNANFCVPLNILISNSTDIFGGGERYVLTLATHLKRRGHAVWVSARPDHLLLRKCNRHDIETIPINFTGMARVFAVASRLRHEMRERMIDVVHSNANYDRTCAALATAFTRSAHVATVHSAHSIQHNITHWLRNRYGIDHFIAVAEAVQDVLINEDRIAPGRITVVPNGVSPNDGERGEDLRREVRWRLGIAERTIVIGNVARLVPFKGHRYLLDAMATLVHRTGNVLVLIAGDGELRATLEEQVQERGIGDAVRFLGFQENVRELYHAFDIYCQPSIERAEEAFPIALLDAMATALPVVATRVGGIPSMVNDAATGFIVPPEQPAKLEEALLRLCTDPVLRERLGRGSYDLFRTRYNAERMTDKVEAIYSRYTNET